MLNQKKKNAYIRWKIVFIVMFFDRFYEMAYFPGIGETADRNHAVPGSFPICSFF